MRQGVGCSHGQDRQGDVGVREHLHDTVGGSVSTAREYRVAAGGDGMPCVFLGVGTGVGENETGVDTCGSQHCHHGLQFRLPPLSSAAGIWVVQQSRLTHGLVEAGLYLSFRCGKGV